VSYLNVTEIDSALSGLAQTYPSLCELIVLPNPTIEGRTCYALRIGRKTSMADAVLFTACAHAREWGGADICVYFAADLLEAYSAGTGLAYGGKWFSSLAIRRIVERLTVVVFPCLNPDGRAFDQQDPNRLWRKNRNQGQSGGNPARVGVDLNRNHSFLWDFRTKFHPQANPSTLASDNPASEIYHGPAPDSEPETRNVHWLLDTHRFVRWHMDIHSFTGDLLFLWGDDTDQTTDWSMNFRNAGYDGQRGTTGAYGEYIASKDLTLVSGTAQRVVDVVNAVRGGHYEAKQSVFLTGTGTTVSYPVSGGVDDYSYSRHRVDCTRRKVYAFTVEFGYWTGDYQTSFHPPWAEMEQIVAEIDAGMVEFCVAATPAFTWPWPWLFRRLWPWQIWDPMVRLLGRLVGPIIQQFRNRAPG
jgi:murein tripeptide amidase MpaA